MPELGAVIGGVLAEFVRSRVIADRLTADLVEQYESHPVLSSMAVPRVTIGEAEVTVRYVIEGVDIPPTKEPNFNQLKADLAPRLSRNLTAELMSGSRGDPEMEDAVLKIAARVKPPTVAQLGKALDGDSGDAVKAMVTQAVKAFSELPPGVRRKLGTKTLFIKQVEQLLSKELTAALADVKRASDLESILASKINVSVKADELPDDTTRIQEITVTVRSEDLDMIDTSEG